MKLILIRHSIRSDTANTDCSITDDGIKLIDDRAYDIFKHIEGRPIAFMSSPFKRTFETTMCLATHLDPLPNIIIEPLLHETLFGNWMEKYIHHSLIRYSRMSSDKLKISKKYENKYETWSDVKLRCKQFLKKIVDLDYKTVVAVTHGGIINSMLSVVDPTYSFDRGVSNPAKYIPDYCDYIVLSYKDGKWSPLYRASNYKKNKKI